MTAAGSVWLILVSEIFADDALGPCAILRSAARADFARSIADDPDSPFAERAIGFSLFGTQPEPDSFCGTRRRDLMRSMAASAV